MRLSAIARMQDTVVRYRIENIVLWLNYFNH